MVVFRLVFGLLMLAAVVCFALAIFKREPRWQKLGVKILKWTVFAALGFFAVLGLEKLFGG